MLVDERKQMIYSIATVA